MEPSINPENVNTYFNDNINLKRYFSLFISNWYLFAIALFITISIAYGINRWSEQIYVITSTLLIKDEQYGGGTTGMDKIIPGGDIFRSQQNLKNEIGILKSFSLHKRVMDSLPEFPVVYKGVGKRNIVESRKYKSTPFIVIYDSLEFQPGIPVSIKILSSEKFQITINGNTHIDTSIKFGERFRSNGFDFSIGLRNKTLPNLVQTKSNKYLFYFIRKESLANLYRGKLGIQPVEEDATLITLSTTGYVPEQEADYLNKLMELYILQGLEYKNQTADSTITFIDGQLRVISKSLYDAEADLEFFRTNNRLMDISKEGSLIQSRLEQVTSEKVTAELQKSYYQYLYDYIITRDQTGAIVSPSTVGINDQLLIKLVNDLSILQVKRREMGFNISNNMPINNLMEQEIDNVLKQLNENVKNSLSQIELTLVDIKERLRNIESEASKLPGTERKLISIQRTFDLNNTVYTYLMEKRAEAGIAKASNVPDNRIIDKANPGNAIMIKPKPRNNYSIAFMLGILLPVIMIILIDLLNNKVIDKKDIERFTSVPIIGYISHNDHKTEVPVTENPGSTLAESFRSVRTALKYFIRETEHPVISVSSTISAEGKTFFSVNLSASLASLGKKVVLIGLDLRKPRIHRVFNIDNQTGLSNYLIGDERPENIIQKTELENLFYVPSGPVPPNPAELIESDEMKRFVDYVKKKFDYVIFDTPPVAIVTDARLLAPFADMNIFIVRQRYSSKSTISLIEELNQNGALKKMCIVINDINLSGYYGYGLRYGYSLGYGYTYGYNYYGQYVYSRYGYSEKGEGYYHDEE